MARPYTVRRLIPLLTLTAGLAACTTAQGLVPGPSGTSSSLHQSPITRNETWTKALSPHVVRGNIQVGAPGGATLTIEPGVEVRFEPGASLNFGDSSSLSGVLKAIGTASQSITFTSARPGKQAGDWEQIAFFNGSAGSELEHVTLAYGGGTSRGLQSSMVWLSGEDARPAFRNCTIEHVKGAAVYAMNDAAFEAFENNVIRDVEDHPLQLGAESAASLGTGNTFSSLGNAHIAIDTQNIKRDTRWRNQGIPYLLTTDLYVAGDSPAVWTLDASTTVKVNAGVRIEVGTDNTAAALHAAGTASSPITFEGAAPTRGFWHTLHLGADAVDGIAGNARTTVLANVRIRNGGGTYGGSPSVGALYIQNCKPLLENVTIENSGSDGAYVAGDLDNLVPSLSTLQDKILGMDNAGELIRLVLPQ